MESPAVDPYEQLIEAAKKALEFTSGRLQKAEQEATKRRGQAARIEKALSILAGEAPAVKERKQRKGWSEEAKEAARQRMLARRNGNHAEPVGVP